MVGIGKLTLRQKEHLVAVRPVGDALVLELMRFEHELVEPDELRFPETAAQKVRPQELAMAEQLIGNLAEPFDPSKYRDEYEEKLKALVKAKLKGKKLPDADEGDEKPEQTKVIDLVARLEESLARRRRGRAPPARWPARRRSARRPKARGSGARRRKARRRARPGRRWCTLCEYGISVSPSCAFAALAPGPPCQTGSLLPPFVPPSSPTRSTGCTPAAGV